MPSSAIAVRVGLVGGALVDGLGLGHDAVGRDLARLRHLRAHDHEVVQLEVVVLVEDDAELAGVRVLGAEDPADPSARPPQASPSASVDGTRARRR